ncbi:hypothetical protein Hanom_Chr16g01450891 [Helianthus anomalus]
MEEAGDAINSQFLEGANMAEENLETVKDLNGESTKPLLPNDCGIFSKNISFEPLTDKFQFVDNYHPGIEVGQGVDFGNALGLGSRPASI